ncbi:hypothetical protein CVIRNUC_007327 [Coccomyxa viridis]|uniref:3-oxo-5-alpha-steroid 4-dehydrogenase C-terminal domain-containing protein n=1 Tax=Coccomyxa viridis TaxID=1274662 RepID=A0AAV1I9S9_9CHLO|nr:hypothetical protein CVIRNUC_007327 [Coccomyxa viridis]
MDALHLTTSSMPTLLLLYWLLCTGAALAALVPSFGWSGFRKAVMLSACRGKLWDKKPDAPLGPLQAARVPQKRFAHFYIVGVACAIPALWLLIIAGCGPAEGWQEEHHAALIAMLCVLFHLSRRLVESCLLLSYPDGAYMHLIAYAFGLSYYVALPLTLLPSSTWHTLDALAYQGQKGAAEWDPCPAHLAQALKHLPGSMSALQVLGVVVFFAGNALQCHSHCILARLRARIAGKREDRLQTTEDGYALPEGGAFSLVSCPHYLGEIVLYAGLALILCGSNISIMVVFAWVVANLLLAAGPTHEWYSERFPSYPRQRRALIPWVY